MSEADENPIHSRYKKSFYNDNSSSKDYPDYQRERPDRDAPYPLMADGHIFISRKEFALRCDLGYKTIGKYRRENIVPQTAWKTFTCYKQPKVYRYYEEYIALVEDNLFREENYMFKNRFYRFIKEKWVQYKDEILQPIPNEWN